MKSYRLKSYKLKTTLFMISVSVLILSVVTLALDTVGSLVYTIYLWGGEGLEFSKALWEGVKTWVIVGITALFTAIASFIGMKATD